MHSDEGQTTSVWEDRAEVPRYAPLGENADADTCVVGAGIAGLSVAYTLARAGKRVVVLDDGEVAGGETSRTTAHVTAALDDFYHEIERVHGPGGARVAAESHTAAIARIEEVARAESIDCDFARVDAYWFLIEGDTRATLDRELEAMRRAGLGDASLVDRAPITTWSSGVAIRLPRQAQFDAVKYVAGLARAVVASGGRIFTGTHVTKIEDGEPCTVTTEQGHRVRARSVVVATNSPVSDWVQIHTKQAAYRTYVIGARIERGAVPAALYWDTGDPYHYARLVGPDSSGTDGDLLIVGGEDHKTGQGDDTELARFGRLEEWTRARFPVTGIEYRWSGQVMEPVDYIGFIGRDPGGKHVYIATGDSGNGITHGTIAGILIPALIESGDHPWAKLYEPGRISLRTAPEFIKENLNVGAQYRDLVTPGETDDVATIKPGEGAVVRRGAHKVACYRAEDGSLVERSALCTHLFCVVDWNTAEKTWDCPCHGSRFKPTGEVINGPAIAPLGEVGA